MTADTCATPKHRARAPSARARRRPALTIELTELERMAQERITKIDEAVLESQRGECCENRGCEQERPSSRQQPLDAEENRDADEQRYVPGGVAEKAGEGHVASIRVCRCEQRRIDTTRSEI